MDYQETQNIFDKLSPLQLLPNYKKETKQEVKNGFFI